MFEDDDALMAELRAISNNSKSSSRFDDEETDTNYIKTSSNGGKSDKSGTARSNVLSFETKAKSTLESMETVLRNNDNEYKSKSLSSSKPQSIDSQSQDRSREERQMEILDESLGFGLKHTMPKTFHGDRGGSANDDDLLAELRAISMRNSSADRFNEDIPREDESLQKKKSSQKPKPKDSPKKTSISPKKDKRAPPPWKTKGIKLKETQSCPFDNYQIEVKDETMSSACDDKEMKKTTPAPVISTPVKEKRIESTQELINVPFLENVDEANGSDDEPVFGGFQDTTPQPKTFKGERGGNAEDEDLLAELRAISMGNASSDRFAGDDDDEIQNDPVSTPVTKKPVQNEKPWQKKSNEVVKKSPSASKKAAASGRMGDELPPWKRKNGKKNAEEKSSQDGDVDVVVSSPRMDRNQQEPASSLRRSTSIHSAPNLFDSRNPQDKNLNFDQTGDMKTAKTSLVQNSPTNSERKEIEIALPPKTNVPTYLVDDITVTEENVGEHINSRNWKLRKASYDFLDDLLTRKVKGRSPMNDVDVSEIHQCITDSLLKDMGKESNASALDSALRFLFGFIDYGKKGCDPETITSIVESIVSGPAMSSARPSTSKSVEAVLMKAMQVSKSKPSSIHIVVGMLLDHGIASRIPKVVIKSLAITLDAARAFGAANLPLSKVISSADKILSHTNGEVREYGINILAELCRSFGSKEPISNLLDKMKPAQVSELDTLLSVQIYAQPPLIGLRFVVSPFPESSALEALQAAVADDAAEKFALREPTNVFDALRETDYNQKMKASKWSEKVNALDTLLRCGGEKPYKLTQPSSSVNYNPLISDLKKLLSHSHYAVKSKSALALAMLAEGVGSKLFSYLRPLLLTLLDLTKDKKVATSIEICLDSLFDNVIGFSHLFEEESGLISVLDEKKQKNALIRKASLSFLNRCVKRSGDAKARGKIDLQNVHTIFNLCVEKSSDSDAGVRREASSLWKELLEHKDESIKRLASSLTQDLEQTNLRVFKLLLKDVLPSTDPSATRSNQAKPPTKQNKNSDAPSSTDNLSNPARIKTSPQRKNKSLNASNAVANPSKQDQKKNALTVSVNDANMPSVQEATDYILKMNVPNWNVDELEGDIVSGLQSNNWKCRCAAISSLIVFFDTHEAKSDGLAYAQNAVIVVKSATKEFRDGNFNVLKSACLLFLKICDFYQSLRQAVDEWMCADAIAICVQKVADKKFVDIVPDLFFRLCEVQYAGVIILFALSEIADKKSPVMIEGLLSLLERFCVDFGVNAMGGSSNALVTWVSEQCGSSNVKVKNSALTLLGTMHKQSGPTLRVLALSKVNDVQVRQNIEKQCEASRFEPSATSYLNRKTLVASRENGKNNGGKQSNKLEMPQIDLMSELPPNILSKLTVKDSKDSWKVRKAALEDIESLCKKNNGLVYSTSSESLKGITDLMKALRSRLDDSQSNLKPMAARNIATILNSVDTSSQQVLGRIVYGPLLRASMNDNKKIVRDATLEALNRGTMSNELTGGGIHTSVMESLIAGFVSELEQSEYKATGLPDVLNFLIKRAQHFPTIHSVTTTKSRSILANFASTLVGCLSSSKSETRAAAESLLKKCVQNGAVCDKDLNKAISKLLPAEQRKVKPTVLAIVVSAPHDEAPQLEARRARSSTPNGVKVSLRRTVHSSSSSRIRSSSASHSSRHSIGVGRREADKINIDQLIKDSNFHPLKSSSRLLISKHNRVMKQRDHIPEYPEEPTNNNIMMTLKKSWSALIPSQTLEVLFPSGGIEKQDDSTNGCVLLSHALSMCSIDGEPDVITEQLDLILRWFNLALCSRETTSGMESLLSFCTELITFLRNANYQFTDSESSSVLPYLLEKSGVAKGRFREKIRQLLDYIRDGDLYPLNKYGSLVCVSVLEHTSNSKTKNVAIKELISCVELNGLPAVGKKGIPIVAKGFAEENIPENKSNYLDLIQCIISKMNGDVDKFLKLCGSTRLSRKDTDAILNKMSRSKIIQLSNKVTSPKASNIITSESPPRSSAKKDEIEGPFKFSFGSKTTVLETSGSQLYSSAIEPFADASGGNAASLRERLRQIRDKHTQEEGMDIDRSFSPAKPLSIHSNNPHSCRLYDEIMQSVDIILQQPTPLLEINEIFTKALTGLRQLHSSLSNNKNDSTGTDPNLLSELRHYLYGKVSETVDMLTRILDFGFRCGSPSNKDGLSVPLLSVSIAGLMAIFLDAKFASQISVKSLTAVIYYSTAALLDKRLSATATPESYGLDSSTSKKMVKAINKLAIQASYGVARHISFITLISLQVKLCTNNGKDLQSSDYKSTGQRMSRIISKLFSRVIKAEETEISPFSRQDFDIASLLQVLENSLLKCKEVCGAEDAVGDSAVFIDWNSYHSSCMSPCISLIDTLVHHVLHAKNNQGKLNELSKALVSLGENSLTAKIFNDGCLKIGISPLHSSPTASNKKSYDVDYLSELIFTIGGAQDGQERLNAMDDLRDYLDAHKDIDIEAHLSGVSSPFRRYILDQLKSPFRPLLTPSERSLFSGVESSSSAAQHSSRSVLSDWSQSNMSMSQKLRYLKNKIYAAEATANSSNQVDTPPPHLPDEEMYQSSPEQSSGPVSSLRQRLAAATERAKVRSPEPVRDVSRPSSILGNAAALRARLESVKRMSRD